MRLFFMIMILATLAISLTNCTNFETQAKNLEQLYHENGVPVKTKLIEAGEFKIEQTYNAVLSGVEESSAYAMIGDKVDKINYQVGQFVKKDDLVISFPTDNPAAQYYQAKVAFENSETAFKRIENLYKSGGISHQDRDNARAQYGVAKANWNAVKQSVKVPAPISGYITRINVRPSDNVHPGDELFTVSKTDRMKAKIWVSEKQISDFRVGLPARAAWNGNELIGKVVQVDLSLNTNKQAFGVTIEFENSDKSVKCGIMANIRVTSHTRSQVITIDRKNVLTEEGESFVFVASNGLAEKRNIITGKTNGLDVEVLGGLTTGDLLITEGQMLLKSGLKINIREKG